MQLITPCYLVLTQSAMICWVHLRMTLSPLKSTHSVLSILSLDTANVRLADVQSRLFAAQVSHVYLKSLNQPPTPSRTLSNIPINFTSHTKQLQTELDTLIGNCSEATKLLARQTVVTRISETLVRGRVDQLEQELDGVQTIEDIME